MVSPCFAVSSLQILPRSCHQISSCHVVEMNPRFSVHTSDKTSPRGFNWIWFLRLAEILVSLIVLALVARDVGGLSSLSCGIPGKMAWNLACVRPPFYCPRAQQPILTPTAGGPLFPRSNLSDPLIWPEPSLQDPSMVDLHPNRSRCFIFHLLDFCRRGLDIRLQ